MPKGQFNKKAILDWRSKFPDKTLYEWVAEQVARNFDDACWIWPFRTSRGGSARSYAYVSIGTPLAGRLPNGRRHVEVHRLAFFLRYGYWPNPMGRHTCNDSLCFNPSHIIPGTNYENVQDMVKADRQCRGERAHAAKLTEDKVRDIYAKRLSGISGREIASTYGITDCAVCDIMKGRTWKHLRLKEAAQPANESSRCSDASHGDIIVSRY